jgi:hypothetical protein
MRKTTTWAFQKNGMSVQVGFSSCEILCSGIVPPNTLKKILKVFIQYTKFTHNNFLLHVFPQAAPG